MRAVILAGGRGKRLRPITDYVPKPLIPINSVPVLEWQLTYLRNNGIRDVIVCAGYKSDMIEDFVRQRRLRRVTVSRESRPLGTAGAIRRVSDMISENAFFVLNGDVITDIGIKRLAAKPNSIASVLLRTKFGTLDIGDGKITEFKEKQHVPNLWMNAGVYCLQRQVFDDLPKRGDLEKTVFPDYARQGRLNTVQFAGAAWHSVDSFKDIEECSAQLSRMTK